MATRPRRAGFRVARSPGEAVDRLASLHQDSVERLRAALLAFARDGEPPEPDERGAGAFAYPELRVTYAPDGAVPAISRAFGKLAAPGVYATSVTRPGFFRDYLIEQLEPLVALYGVKLETGPSAHEIPYPYVLSPADEAALEGLDPGELARLFPAPDLTAVGDELVDGDWVDDPSEAKPLALFYAPRVDYSMHRLKHYTGADPEHVQQFILFTNYHRYVDEFLNWAADQLQRADGYDSLSAPGGIIVDRNTTDPVAQIAAGPWRRYQMPAYHLRAPDRWGVTLVNIGVGPSNAKTITDHLAVVRPQCWLMIGHCGGLRHSQRLGDYVLAHAYLRRDRVLDEYIPLDVPIPPIAEIQTALQEAAARVTGETGEALKRRLRTGTVVTDADRNWELRSTIEARRFNKSRAIAIDMESATIAANGFRLRVPYGTLLCVSDKPLHGELKLPGPARRFYEQAVSQHLKIGLETVTALKRDDASALHSRKLRAFDEPPFR